MLPTVFFAVAALAALVGLRLTGPARARDLHAAPVVGTAAFILLLAALAAATIR
ncbi:hypothetical protein LG634_14455 [Streptomyces bambusae]|uniref:hypothetical protein n=1 Tax=Streptomyces bambusae TaxID=1550616 RepID=UPI001CFC6739|nr:hypothetical protein [Streptomyces bambusae]MCB5166033.1 hypothetical protein [Streptomyces bambusae]